MKMNKLTLVLAAIVASFGAVSTASAQIGSYGSSDLVLGFQIGSGQGSNTDVEVDLGSYTNFLNVTGTITLSQLSVTDLNNTYSSTWSNTDGTGVNWSVAGVNNGVPNNMFLTSTSQLKLNSASRLATPYGQIGGLIGDMNSGNATQGSNSSTVTIGTNASPAANDAASYTSEEGGNGYNYASNAEQSGAGTDELYFLKPGTSTTNAQALGFFTLGSNGTLTFTGAATPEPSAYALGICALLLFWVLKRRHSVA